ncbi:MAG: tetratricopeptide repeat protein [Ignavibacteria bacterium]
MKRNMLAALLLAMACAIGSALAAEPTLHEVYQAAEGGRIKQAEAMMDQVLRDHPNSAKAHYVEAELLAKDGRVDMAKAELATAERLSPGLPFAKPEAVRELRARLSPVAAPAAAAPASAAEAFPWSWLLLGGFVLAAFVFFVRSVLRARAGGPVYAAAPAGYGAGGQTFGAPGVGPMGPAAPAGGFGSGMLGGLATGVAVGAGVAAGEALMHRMLDGGHHAADALSSQPTQSFDAPGSFANDDMGGADFGVSDGGSWDDGGSGGGDWN